MRHWCSLCCLSPRLTNPLVEAEKFDELEGAHKHDESHYVAIYLMQCCCVLHPYVPVALGSCKFLENSISLKLPAWAKRVCEANLINLHHLLLLFVCLLQRERMSRWGIYCAERKCQNKENWRHCCCSHPLGASPIKGTNNFSVSCYSVVPP